MRHLFTPEGESELVALAARRPLLGFDFDGTLAPIVAQPELARVPVATLRRLRQLASRLPLAVISGRSVADLRSRLGFEPTYVVGSHGAEVPHHESPPSWSAALAGVRAGAQPVERLASCAVVLAPSSAKGSGRKLDALARRLRTLPVPVIGRVQDNALWMDLRCLQDEAGLLAQLQRTESEARA